MLILSNEIDDIQIRSFTKQRADTPPLATVKIRYNKRGKREFPLGSVWLIETNRPISLRMQNAFECTLGIIKAAFVGAFREFQCTERRAEPIT